jgi:hypothetical protein
MMKSEPTHSFNTSIANQSMTSQKEYNGNSTMAGMGGESLLNMSKAISSIRDYDEMRRWAVDMTYRGARMFEVSHGRAGNNEKELSVRQGELVEVLDDKRNWWKLRNFYGQVGYAPVTILKRFDVNNNNGAPAAAPPTFSSHHNNPIANQMPEKVCIY